MKTVIIDGQGGRLGSLIAEAVKKNAIRTELLAIGTNSAATAAMLKAGADAGATGENPVIVACRDAESSAEQIGKDFVLSRKPNPAHVAESTDPEVIKKEISETAKLCLKYGCPCDITLKDISTVSDKPENLILWAQTASAVLDEYYGEE